MGLLEKNQKNSSSTTLNYIFLLKPKVSKLLVPFAQCSFYAENTVAKRKKNCQCIYPEVYTTDNSLSYILGDQKLS